MFSRTFRMVALILLVVASVSLALGWYVHGHNVAVLEPAGQIGEREQRLIVVAILLSVIVVVPVYIMAITIALKYREQNHRSRKVKYEPEWDRSRLYEAIWWGVPLAIITVLSVITWISSHSLDPYKPLNSSGQTVEIEVIALDWKWLFIYPDRHIASVNMVEFPVGTQLDFHLTSDTVMNSFWIPQLGSQIYAMPGMSSQLHLQADKLGSYRGTPANIAGKGFSHMTFTARSVTESEFEAWVKTAQRSARVLDMDAYDELAKPSQDNPTVYYSDVSSGLYNMILMKYDAPSGEGSGM